MSHRGDDVLFFVDDDLRARCWIGVFGSVTSVSIIVATLAVYFRHPYYKESLRENFNTMTALACAWHLVVSGSRIVSSGALLTGQMTEDLCVITGALNVCADSAGLVMLLGFYWSLLSLRLSVLRRLYQCIVPQEWSQHFGVALAVMISASLGSASAVLTVFSGSKIKDTATPFGIQLGWCAGGVNPALFWLSHGVSLALLVATSFGCFIALRCDGCLGLRIRQRLTCTQHWPLYARFFGVVGIALSLYSLLFLIHSVGTDLPHYLTVCAIIGSLWSAGIAILFLFTEGVLQTGLRRLCRGCTMRSQQTTPTSRKPINNAPVDASSLLHEEDMKVTDSRFSEDSNGETKSRHSDQDPVQLAQQDYIYAIRGGGFTAIMRTLMSIEMRTQPLNCV